MPGTCRGYGQGVADGFSRSSRYVAVRDGTRMALDPPKRSIHPSSGGRNWSTAGVVQQVGRGDFDPAIIEAVRNLGVAVEVLDEAEHCGQSSYLIGVAIGRESGRLMGGIAKPFNGVVVAD